MKQQGDVRDITIQCCQCPNRRLRNEARDRSHLRVFALILDSRTGSYLTQQCLLHMSYHLMFVYSPNQSIPNKFRLFSFPHRLIHQPKEKNQETQLLNSFKISIFRATSKDMGDYCNNHLMSILFSLLSFSNLLFTQQLLPLSCHFST